MRTIIKLFILSILTITSLISCLDKDLQNQRDEEARAIKEYIDGKNFTVIGDMIYLKFYNREGIELRDSNIVIGNAFVTNYNSTLIDESLIETTDSALGAANFPGRYFIYGPSQLRSGYILNYGLDTAVKYFSAGDTGTIVIPSWYNGTYSTLIYHMGVKQVIKNDTVNEQQKFTDFFFTNGFSVEDELISGVYWKHPTDPIYELSDTIVHEGQPIMKVELVGRYAETYYSSGLGRQFYPIEAAGDTNIHDRKIGDGLTFPFLSIIDSALIRMQEGDELEIIGGSGFGWGSAGYRDPALNIPIVPEYMPVYYRLKLIGVTED